MNTTRGTARRRRLAKISAAVAAALITAGLAAAGTVPARAGTLDPPPPPAAAASAAVYQPVLHEGSRGAAVQDWQATLNKLAAKGMPGQPRIAADGIFGPKTKAATQVFQRWAHITAAGIAGVQTYTAAA